MADMVEKVYANPTDTSGILSALVSANCKNGDCYGFNNMWNNPFMYLIWLAMFGGDGFFGNRSNNTQNAELMSRLNNIQALITDTHANDLAMQAINGNGQALHELAGNLNVGVVQLSNAINSVQSAIQNIGALNGIGQERVINSIILGNKDLVQQIASCCCENKQLVTTMGYEGQLRDQANTGAVLGRIDQLSNGIQQGFASTAFETQAQTSALNFNLQNQTQALKDTANSNTDAIIAKLNQMTTDAQQDKINTLTAQLTAANSRAERQAELQPIINQLNAIKAAQPATATITYPNLVAYPSYLQGAANASIYGSNSFWG